jgi:uncharacterized membrane protein
MPDLPEPISIAPETPPSRFITLRNAFFAGALLVAPLFLTIWALGKVIDIIGGTFRPYFFFAVPPSLRDRPSLDLVWDILATLIVIGLLTLLGYVSRYVLGKFFFGVVDRFIHRLPGVGAIYTAVKQIVDTFGSQKRHLLNKVVLVEFPRKGAWTIGFLTNREAGEAQAKTGEEVWTVFVPTTPNPTSGFLLMFPRAEVVELEMTVGEGMKMIISGGAFVPSWPLCPPSPSKPKPSS